MDTIVLVVCIELLQPNRTFPTRTAFSEGLDKLLETASK